MAKIEVKTFVEVEYVYPLEVDDETLSRIKSEEISDDEMASLMGQFADKRYWLDESVRYSDWDFVDDGDRPK